MAWSDLPSVSVGQLIDPTTWGNIARACLAVLKTHAHDGTTGGGAQSIGPLVQEDFTDAAAPAAPGAGKTRLYAISSRVGARAGAAGAATVLVDQSTAETLANKTLTTPVIASFANAAHSHADAAGGGALTGVPVIVVKAADGSAVNNSTTTVADGELLFPMLANEVWIVDLWLFTSGTDNSAGFKADWDLPAGATHHSMLRGIAPSAGEGLGGSADVAVVGTIALPILGNTNGLPMIHMHSVIRVGGTAGNATLEWAQQAATVQDTKVLADSYLIAHKAA